MLYYINWKSFSLIAFTSQDIGQHVYSNVCFPGCDVIKFKINFIFLTKLLLYRIKEWRQKFLRTKILRTKKLLRWNKKRFSLFSKHTRLLKMVSTLRACKSNVITLNIFHKLLQCFHCRLWISQCRLGWTSATNSAFFIFVIYAESVKVSLMV